MFPLPKRMRLLPLALCAAFTLTAQDADMAERLFLSGERAYAARAYGEALETWNQLLQSSPKSPFAAQALLRMARHQHQPQRRPGGGGFHPRDDHP